MNGAAAGAIIVFVIFSGVVITTWVVQHYRSLRAGRPAELKAIEDRLARIEMAVDAIAVEAERISEGQRFTTKLLAERTHAREGA